MTAHSYHQKWGSTQDLRMPTFWGKLKLEGDRWVLLSLTKHCLDVAWVFRYLASQSQFRSRLSTAAGMELSSPQLDRLAVLALLHDLGKANLAFQNKPFQTGKTPRVGHIRPIVSLMVDDGLAKRAAQAIEADTLESWFTDPAGGLQFLIASWSHHGTPQRFDPTDITGTDLRWWQADGTRDPFDALSDLLHAARSAFPEAFNDRVVALPSPPAFQHRFAGLIMLADWLGSHEAFFPINRLENFDPREAARLAIESVGLDATMAQADLRARPASFAERFGLPQPAPLQAALDRLSCSDPATRLLIAEAETGSGKTEAALARFFHLFAAGAVDALYFALPTRVAARGLYDRICAYVERAFPDTRIRPHVLLAVPGYARVDRHPVTAVLPEESRWSEEPPRTFWAGEHPKRYLAAVVAVGTIDQALLSTLQTRHAHLRSVCLDRSLLVVDEVHASDPYMRRLLAGLLTRHVRLGGHALLLSATLGAVARTDYLASAGGAVKQPSLDESVAAPYPALTNLSGNPIPLLGAARRSKRVAFDLRPDMDRQEDVVREVARAVSGGARVLVVCNTVSRAIALQRLIEKDPRIPDESMFRCRGVVCPHHGRFAPTDRELLDAAVGERLGKGCPEGGLVLVGTQTLEQSLDIDADLLITDLCPADVLLQRVGRLHRHERSRAPGFESARCVVLTPAGNDLEALLDANGKATGIAKSAGLGSVYPDLRCLELTRRLLLQRVEVDLPEDNRRLVEGATHPDALATLQGESWQRHGEGISGTQLSQELAAHYAAAPYEQPFGDIDPYDVVDHPQARTRLGLDNFRVPLPEPLSGPFGEPIAELSVPEHLIPSDSRGELLAEVLSLDDGIRLRLAGQTLHYTRFGLEKVTDESAQ